MANSPVRSEKFGFFTLGSRPDLSGASAVASASLQQELIAAGTLMQISQQEGEDAALTGGTRSLSRRLLALNLAPFRSQPTAVARAYPPLSA